MEACAAHIHFLCFHCHNARLQFSTHSRLDRHAGQLLLQLSPRTSCESANAYIANEKQRQSCPKPCLFVSILCGCQLIHFSLHRLLQVQKLGFHPRLFNPSQFFLPLLQTSECRLQLNAL